MRYSKIIKEYSVHTAVIIVILFFPQGAFSKVITQFVPTFSITEEYTDNYNQTENNTDDEFSTIYSAGFSFGVIGKNANMFLNYNPEYTDYNIYDENDSWQHEVELIGEMKVSKHLTLSVSESYVRDLDRTITTNTWEQHDTNTTSGEMLYEFGERNRASLSYSYVFDDYEEPSADEFTSHRPSVFLSYWFTPRFGLNLGASYEITEYDISSDEPETWAGDIRLLRSLNRSMDAYLSYEYTHTDEDSGDHTIHNPSVGLDWRQDEDFRMSIGIGILFQEWDNLNSDESEDLFLEFDLYKNFDLTRKASLAMTGSSGYVPTGDEAASLGFNIYYEAGLLLSYRLTRSLTAELSSSYEIDQFDEPTVNRKDKTLGMGAGLEWNPLRWMEVRLTYEFTDYKTDDTAREDFQENVGMFTISLTPPTPVRFDSSNNRAVLEDRLFE